MFLFFSINYLNNNKHNDLLNKPITEDEVVQSINSFVKESSPSNDGITYSFYKIFIEKVKLVLCKLFNHFMNGGIIDEELKESTIILLYKKGFIKLLIIILKLLFTLLLINFFFIIIGIFYILVSFFLN